MEAFVAAGGKLAGDALLPYKCIEGQAPDLAQRIEKLFGIDPAALQNEYRKLSGIKRGHRVVCIRH